MMLRPRTILLIGLTLVFLLSLSVSRSEQLRAGIASVLSPLWKCCHHVASGDGQVHEQKIASLELENAQLRLQVERLAELLEFEESTDYPLTVPAHVVYRSPATWNSYCWLDAGEVDNERFAVPVIAKNSPVVVGKSLVGIVDMVMKRQCRVRLITDPGFTPSVRAARGDPQRQNLLEHLDAVASALAQDEVLLPSGNKRELVLEALLDVREALQVDRPSWLMAKGELQGNSSPLWRSNGTVLRGVGFNYDFADEHGPARDLVSGRPVGSGQDQATVPLLKVDDLLITTGLDGILPAGLHVAEVTYVHPLNEGDYFYELEARPTVGDLDSLNLVSILPPQNQNIQHR
jgi:rod shape-determining protein MreC